MYPEVESNFESQFLAKGGIRVIARYFQVGLGEGEGLGFRIFDGRLTFDCTRVTTFDIDIQVSVQLLLVVREKRTCLRCDASSTEVLRRREAKARL